MMKEAIYDAVRQAIEAVGLEAIKKGPFFGIKEKL
jgi:hypothetical protein|tara:strand:- start:647 stop:751 length:105 start_codon:yes stop_codon:yes gene_type:complete